MTHTEMKMALMGKKEEAKGAVRTTVMKMEAKGVARTTPTRRGAKEADHTTATRTGGVKGADHIIQIKSKLEFPTMKLKLIARLVVVAKFC